MLNTDEMELAGMVGVDSGQLVIADPCYIDTQWESNTEPQGHGELELTEKGEGRFPLIQKRLGVFPFPWGSYASVCPALGMSINDARDQGLVREVQNPTVRDFSYRGACSVSHTEGDNFGQLNYRLGHAGAGVAISTGWGDGLYPVYVARNSAGRITHAIIDFEMYEEQDRED